MDGKSRINPRYMTKMKRMREDCEREINLPVRGWDWYKRNVPQGSYFLSNIAEAILGM